MSVSLGQDAVKIEWKPKVGDTVKIKGVLIATTDGSQGYTELTLVQNSVRTIMKIQENGNVTAEYEQVFVSGEADGNDITAMLSQETIVSTVVKSSRGVALPLGDSGEEQPDTRMRDALTFLFPDKALKKGESWTREHSADSKAGIRSSKCVYTYLGIETIGKRQTYKISVEFEEREGSMPISCKGTTWLSVIDGSGIKNQYSLKNAILGGIGIADAEMMTERIE